MLQVLTDVSYTRAVDWWGLGVLIYEMLVGEVSHSVTIISNIIASCMILLLVTLSHPIVSISW